MVVLHRNPLYSKVPTERNNTTLSRVTALTIISMSSIII